MPRAVWLLIAVVGCAAPQLRPAPDPDVRGATPEPEPEPDHIGSAAELLDQGDEAGAVTHLTAHVAAHPDAVMIRAYLAELHYKQGQLGPARRHFARFVRDAAGMDGPAGKHLVHCHTRLMGIASATDDAFAEQLHRGIGLVLLVRQWDAEPAPDEEMVETTLVRAAAALKAARELNATDPRVHLYLAEAWGRLGQPSSARAARRAAAALLPDARLSDAESARLRAAE